MSIGKPLANYAAWRHVGDHVYMSGVIAVDPATQTVVTRYDQLPRAAQRYLQRIEQICEVPVVMISTGADRAQTIVLRHPFK